MSTVQKSNRIYLSFIDTNVDVTGICDWVNDHHAMHHGGVCCDGSANRDYRVCEFRLTTTSGSDPSGGFINDVAGVRGGA